MCVSRSESTARHSLGCIIKEGRELSAAISFFWPLRQMPGSRQVRVLPHCTKERTIQEGIILTQPPGHITIFINRPKIFNHHLCFYQTMVATF